MDEIRRNKINLRSSKKETAGEEKPDGLFGNQEQKKGKDLPVYFGDYRPRYKEKCDIYEKARNHAKKQKKKVLTTEEECDKLLNVVATDKEVSTEHNKKR